MVLPNARAIIDAFPDFILLVATDGTIIDANRALHRALGLDGKALAGRNLFGLVAGDTARAAEYFRRCTASGDPLPGRLGFRRPERAALECRCDGMRLSRPAGAPAAILLRCRQQAAALSRFTLLNRQIGELTRETAARLAAETALRELADTLEQQVAERTRQLAAANAQSTQAQRMAAVGRLTGGVAHDFNNLLTVVLGALEVIEAEIGDGRLGRLVQSAKRAAVRGAILTDQLLAFSRQQVLKPQSIDINRLLAGMNELLRGLLGTQLALCERFAPDIWAVRCDPPQLQSAVLNLVLNARDAMPAGGTLTVETANVVVADGDAGDDMQPGPYVVLAVTDTGSGIPPEIVDRIFEPFFSTKEIGKGTGLGLSQVYGFVKQSGGHARVDSALGAGTTMRLYLPRGTADGEATAGTAAMPPAGGAAGRTVLVVEDEADVRDFAATVLRELGYRVLEAADGREALQILRADPRHIDLLFTDMVMPGPNGSEVAKAALAVRPELKVLFTSGYTANTLPLGRALDGQLIRKPYRAADLAREIRGILPPN